MRHVQPNFLAQLLELLADQRSQQQPGTTLPERIASLLSRARDRLRYQCRARPIVAPSQSPPQTDCSTRVRFTTAALIAVLDRRNHRDRLGNISGTGATALKTLLAGKAAAKPRGPPISFGG
jgi:hypothetical protein